MSRRLDMLKPSSQNQKQPLAPVPRVRAPQPSSPKPVPHPVSVPVPAPRTRPAPPVPADKSDFKTPQEALEKKDERQKEIAHLIELREQRLTETDSALNEICEMRQVVPLQMAANLGEELRARREFITKGCLNRPPPVGRFSEDDINDLIGQLLSERLDEALLSRRSEELKETKENAQYDLSTNNAEKTTFQDRLLVILRDHHTRKPARKPTSDETATINLTTTSGMDVD
ncbi:hypothetical protein WR25_04489 [Diploscapter pachys]|uniref:Uncharacterized protein n=1 Tax=Diploscapter pachys TaxID=2018661 RepID=A0A2A2LG30_9BILA|nr:hypothetical protein WR25_04489 [Diploscapter pachys]